MWIIELLTSLLLLGALLYSLFYPYFKRVDHTKFTPTITIEEEPVAVEETPAPKKKRPYRKRKPKNDKGEK